MKIDGLEFIDWLHKIRRESERARKKRNCPGSVWLKEVKEQADQIMKQLNLKQEFTKRVTN